MNYHIKKQLSGNYPQEHGMVFVRGLLVVGYNPPWVPGSLEQNEVRVQVNNWCLKEEK